MLAVGYPWVLGVAVMLAFAVASIFGALGVPSDSQGVWVADWIEWAALALVAFFAILLSAATGRLSRRLVPIGAWATVWVWSSIIVLSATVLALLGPPDSATEFVTDTPGGFWVLALAGLLGFWLGWRSGSEQLDAARAHRTSAST
jgi:hypothetical protein